MLVQMLAQVLGRGSMLHGWMSTLLAQVLHHTRTTIQVVQGALLVLVSQALLEFLVPQASHVALVLLAALPLRHTAGNRSVLPVA